MSAAAVKLSGALLSGAIHFLVQKQKVEALIVNARIQGRDVSDEELRDIKATRDMLVGEVNSLLDSIE